MRHCFALSLAVLVAAFSLAAPVHAARSHTPTWAECVRHMRWQDINRVHVIDCTRYPMPKHAGERVTGHTKTCTRRSPHVVVCVRFPAFAAPRWASAQSASPMRGYGTTLLVTGYSWGCGATGSTASGQWPFVGGAAADPGQFPFGTRIAIAGLWTVTINDTGGAIGAGHIDVFFPSCGQAIQWGARYVPATIGA